MTEPINVNDWVTFEPQGHNLYITYGKKRFKLWWDIRIDEDYTWGVPHYDTRVSQWVPAREVIKANLVITMYSEPPPPPPQRKRRKRTDLGLRVPR